MKTTKMKNYKELENVFNHCAEKHDTLLAIFAPKNVSTGGVMFTGNEKSVANGLATIITNSLADDADAGAKKLGNAVLNAITMVLAKHDATANRFATLLGEAVDLASKKNDEHEHEFDPDDKLCGLRKVLHHIMDIAKRHGIKAEAFEVGVKRNKKRNGKKDDKK
jgi:hypothetical protein